MNHRRILVAVGVSAGLLSAGCTEYASSDPAGAGGGQAGTTAVAAGSGGQAGGAGATSGGSGGQAGGGAGGSNAGSGGGGAGGTGGSGGMMQLPCVSPLPPTEPCGGDVVGTWTATACPLMLSGEVDMTGFGLGCTSGTVTSGSLELAGTFTADAGGTYTDNTATTGEEEIELPAECLVVSGTTTTCADLQGAVGSSLGYSSFTCVDNAVSGGCTCNGSVDQLGGLAMVSINASTSGTYTSVDDALTSTALGTDTEYSYCITANTMVMTLQSLSKIGTLMGPIVLQK
jgi:hypothetical protein